MIEGRRRLIATGFLDSEEAAEDDSIENDGAALDEDDKSSSGEAGVRTCFTQSGTEEVEEVHRVVNYFSLSSCMLKPTSLLTQGFNKNKKSQEKLFNHYAILGHGQSGGRGEEPSVPILMLRSEMINTVWSIQPLWTASQVT